jgi:uncharacterized protein YggE
VKRFLHEIHGKRVTAFVFALALILPASASAQDRTITVTGSATQNVPNDAASLSFSVSKERRSRQAALRIVAIRLHAVIAAVQAAPGIGPGDLTTGEISVRGVSRGEHKIWRASEGVRVISHQPKQAGALVNAAVAAGATGIRGPSFFPSNPDTAYTNTLLAAFDQAKARATALATHAGAILGPAISIQEGTEMVPSAPSAETAGPRGSASKPPVKPGSSTVTATVLVVFALE